MDRKEFLSTCAAGLCACAAGSLIPASRLSAGETASPDDWRLRFVKERYARMLQLLSDRMDKENLNQTLHDLGAYCASLWDQTIVQHRGDFDGFRKLIKQGSSGDDVTWDREKGVIRDLAHAYSKDGGLAVLKGNLALDGCIVKTAGVDASVLKFEGPAKVFESQDDASRGILAGEVVAGDVVVIRYEGPRGGPGMQEMLYPTSYIKSKGLGKACALITDGRFSGGTSGLSIGHVSPEAAEGGAIALVEPGDRIAIDIPNRKVELKVGDTAAVQAPVSRVERVPPTHIIVPKTAAVTATKIGKPGHGEVLQTAIRSASLTGTSRRRSTWEAQSEATRHRACSSIEPSRIDAAPRAEMINELPTQDTRSLTA